MSIQHGNKVRELRGCVFPKNRNNCRTLWSRQNGGYFNNWKKWLSVEMIWDLSHKSVMIIPYSSANGEIWSILKKKQQKTIKSVRGGKQDGKKHTVLSPLLL